MIKKTRSYLYSLFDGSLFFSGLGQTINKFFVVLILLNVAAVIIDSDPQYHRDYEELLISFEIFSVLIFSIEYLIRIFIAVEKDNPDKLSHLQLRLKYITSFVGVIDLLAILPFYLSAFTSMDLRFLRLMRILRLFKLSHYFKGLNFFLTVLKKESLSIGSAIFSMMILVIISASAMHNLEHQAQPEAFSSIPDAIWWAVVTMTTVGYGDITPITFGGKLLATFIMLLGVGVVALPAGILAARFGDELKTRKDHLKAHVAQALNDGHMSRLEEHELQALCKSLELSEDELQQIIKDYQLENQAHLAICPHCNKKLNPGRRKNDRL
ncbi:MAG: ion transporter [Gammaproteobacteria bacterium]|nr:ion transporter [Gammaproteobacteria bacterium]